MIRSYSELSTFESFDDRFDYLKLGGSVGRATFAFDRHVNQQFYMSKEWQDVRQFVIFRDNGCDLGVPGYEIHISPLIHHMNPMTVQDIIDGVEWIVNPEYLITTTHNTHNSIHYGRDNVGPKVVTQRLPGDTALWARR